MVKCFPEWYELSEYLASIKPNQSSKTESSDPIGLEAAVMQATLDFLSCVVGLGDRVLGRKKMGNRTGHNYRVKMKSQI